MHQAEEENAKWNERLQRVEGNLQPRLGQVGGHQHVQTGEQDPRSTEGKGQVLCNPAAQSRAKLQRSGPLQEPQVELAWPVDAVEQRRQAPVEAEERVAPEEFLWIGDVGQFQIIA